jgi:integrase
METFDIPVIIPAHQQRIDGPGASLARRRYQRGNLNLYEGARGKAWVLRWREDAINAAGSVQRVRRSEVLGTLRDYATRRLAMRAAEQRLAALNCPTYRARPTATFAQFAARWQQSVLAQLKPSTALNYQSHLRRHLVPYFGATCLKDIEGEQIQRFIATTQAGSKTKRNVIITLQSIWRQARAWNYVAHDPFAGLVFPRHRSARRVFFTVEEICKILHGTPRAAGASGALQTFFWLAAETGMRAGELCGLRVEDINFTAQLLTIEQSAWRGTIQSPKTARAVRMFTISPELAENIREHLQHTWRPNAARLLFASRTGRPWDANLLVKRKLHPLLVALEIPRAGLHAFRHANSTIMDQLGAPMRVRQERLGHSDARLTLGTYTHLVSADDARLARAIGSLLAVAPQPIAATPVTPLGVTLNGVTPQVN